MILCLAGIGIALFLGDTVLRIIGGCCGSRARLRCLAAGFRVGVRDLHLRLGIGLGGGLHGLGFLDTNILGRAALVVAAFLGYRIGGLGRDHACLVAAACGWLVAGLEVGLGDLLAAPGFGDADIPGVAGKGIAGGLLGLVLAFDLLPAGLVVVFCHALRHGAGTEGQADCERQHAAVLGHFASFVG